MKGGFCCERAVIIWLMVMITVCRGGEEGVWGCATASVTIFGGLGRGGRPPFWQVGFVDPIVLLATKCYILRLFFHWRRPTVLTALANISAPDLATSANIY